MMFHLRSAHILHDFITSTPFKEKSSDHFKDHKMKLLTNFDITISRRSYELNV